MTANGWLQIVVFLGAVLLLTKPLGLYLARVFDRRRTWLDPLARPVERLLYRLTRVDETHEMRWTEYAAAMLLFSLGVRPPTPSFGSRPAAGQLQALERSRRTGATAIVVRRTPTGRLRR
jgi:hypothetical protein